MRIIVGMSGGVDSALTAALLKKEGHDVIGLTLQLYSYKEPHTQIDESKKHCDPLAFIESARSVADHIGIPHYVLNREDFFQHTIIDPFLQAYQEGKTPLPCVRCNRDVKTQLMYAMMQDWKADAIATGHYVRCVHTTGKPAQLHQGQDRKRDQSFFLFALTQEQLNVLHCPLGGYSKEETRQKAEELGLSAAHTPASQDLCFIAKKSYKTLFEKNPGPLYHENGTYMGEHQGIQNYTVGQRAGIGVGGQSEPLYVVHINPQNHVITVGPRESLARTVLLLEHVNWLHEKKPSCLPLFVKIRSAGMLLAATIDFMEGDRAKVVLHTPEYGVSPGQVCVFYEGTRLVGGGWIV